MENCIFCRIAKGEIPCMKIWENEKYLAFLDINPVTEGMTLVIPKKHKDSRVFKNENSDICEIMSASKEVSGILENKLNIERVGLIFEGVEVDHLHAKLIPIKDGENIKMILQSHYPKPEIKELEDLCKRITN